MWSEILAAARERSRSTGALLVNATVRAVRDDTLVLAIGAAPLARRLSEPRNTDVIADALRAVLGVQWRVRCEHGEGPGEPQGRPRQPAARSAPQQSAPVQQAEPAPARRREPEPRTPPSRPTYQRPGRQAAGNGGRDPQPRSAPAAEQGVPLPPEPPDEEPPPEDEEAMLAEAAAARREPAVRRDPEEMAIELLSTELGARAIDQA